MLGVINIFCLAENIGYFFRIVFLGSNPELQENTLNF